MCSSQSESTRHFLNRPMHIHTQPFNGLWSGSTSPVGQYQKKHSPTHTYPDHRISFIHLLQSTTSSLFSLHGWHSFWVTSLQVLFGLPLGLGPSTSYTMHFFTQLSSFRSTCPYHRSLNRPTKEPKPQFPSLGVWNFPICCRNLCVLLEVTK